MQIWVKKRRKKKNEKTCTEMQLFSTIDSRRPFPPSVLLYEVAKKRLFDTLPSPTPICWEGLIFSPKTRGWKLFLTAVRNFSIRGQKYFYSRSENILFAVRKISRQSETDRRAYPYPTPGQRKTQGIRITNPSDATIYFSQIINHLPHTKLTNLTKLHR